MTKRVFVDDELTEDGKYKVVQEDSEAQNRFAVKEFDSKEVARKFAEDMQTAIDKSSEYTSSEYTIGETATETSKFKDTDQDLKLEGSQE